MGEINRRRFLKNMTLLTAAGSVPSYLFRTLQAARGLGLNDQAEGKVLCVLELNGGWDGLYSIVPYSNDFYYQNRPVLGLSPSQVLKIDDDFGFHPGMSAIKSLFDDGKVSIIHGVGYPNPNRSHFRSQDIWYTAAPATISSDGWLGKYIGTLPSGPLQGVSIGGGLSKSLLSSTGVGSGIRTIEGFRLLADETTDTVNVNSAFGRLMSLPRDNQLEEFAARTALDATISAEDIIEGQGNYQSTVFYPSTILARQMQMVARLIAADVGIKVFYVLLGGFDTHANQIRSDNNLMGRHSTLIEQFSEAVKAFHEDMVELGRSQDVIIMTVSEFGRRLAENASLGTDHGTANPILMIGDAVKPGFFGNMPSLAPEELDSIGDVKHNIDFRQTYATVLEKWLGADSAAVLGQPFELLDVLS